MELSSRSRLDWLETEQSSGKNTLVLSNTDSESRTTTQQTEDNGSFSTGELDLSELSPTETRLSQYKRELKTFGTTATLVLSETSKQLMPSRE